MPRNTIDMYLLRSTIEIHRLNIGVKFGGKVLTQNL